MHATQIPTPSQHGYPNPGPQSPTGNEVMDAVYFTPERVWHDVLRGPYDFIVLGSGFTALAFAQAALKENPFTRILMLERGGFWLPEHFQMMPLPFKYTLGGLSETFPWTLTDATTKTPVQYMHGSCPFVGGRSTFWSAWSPSPTPDLMRGWPEELKRIPVEDPRFWPEAKALLRVTSANEILDGVYGRLQSELTARLQANAPKMVPSAEQVVPAPLAVGDPDSKRLKFNKFSVPGPLVQLVEQQKALAAAGKGSPLHVVDRCVVERLVTDGQPSGATPSSVLSIATSRGLVPVGQAKVVLSMGMVPATTLLKNAFPAHLPLAGARLTGHFLTHVAARIPLAALPGLARDGLQIAATYLAGRNARGYQYHIQITGIHSPDPGKDAEDAARECPDYAAAATPQQLADSRDHIVLVCATLGELTERNPDSWIRANPSDPDPTTNVLLQVLPNAEDMALWDEMDEATFQAIAAMATTDPDVVVPIEYWHNRDGGPEGSWSRERPGKSAIRIPGLVHEASGLWMGNGAGDSVVGPDFRPHGVENVYVTGASIFPTSGSWNPTLTMCGYAQHLARRLVRSQAATPARV